MLPHDPLENDVEGTAVLLIARNCAPERHTKAKRGRSGAPTPIRCESPSAQVRASLRRRGISRWGQGHAIPPQPRMWALNEHYRRERCIRDCMLRSCGFYDGGASRAASPAAAIGPAA